MVLYRLLEKIKPNKLILSEKWEDGQKYAVTNFKNKHEWTEIFTFSNIVQKTEKNTTELNRMQDEQEGRVK